MKKKLISILFLASCIISVKAQTCRDLIASVQSKADGTTYSTEDSESVSSVTFYSLRDEHDIYHFAIVCSRERYFSPCSEHIYLVAPTTESVYALNYRDSAGKAFWDYIQPYNKNLGCGSDGNSGDPSPVVSIRLPAGRSE